ncbi:DNA mismatch repair protein msh6 [Blyttiomyces sp. JEL0837]|nr:DNA mismatch repair protein msh6 [Blyttiomyces sp. JEL0837]
MLGQSGQSSSMKKSSSGSQQGSAQRTITSFFTAPPKTPKTPSAQSARPAASLSGSSKVTSKADDMFMDLDEAPTSSSRPVPMMIDGDGDNSEMSATRPSQRKRRMIIDDDEDDDEKPDVASNVDEDKSASKRSRTLDDFEVQSNEMKTPSARRSIDLLRTYRSGGSPVTPQSTVPASSPGTTPGSKSTPFSTDKKRERAEDFKKRNDERYSWLLDERDADGRRPGEEGHDPRTLFIPKHAWAKFSAFEKQFWEIKAAHWDTVVFFKKGKFYELYEKDADIAHQEFDWKLTDRVNMKMCGVPDHSFDIWAAQFIAKGYKIAKVDQVESLVAKEIREKKQGSSSAKEDKIIRRELTMILTSGTLVDPSLLTDDMSTYCMAIKEEIVSDNSAPTFAICFVDTSTAQFQISYFEDDVDRTKFETLIVQLKPKELVLEKGLVNPKTLRLLKNCLSDPILNFLHPDKEFWDAQTTADNISKSQYFAENKDFPEVIKGISQNELAMSALGGLLSYLKTLKLDKDLASIGNFKVYDPLQSSGTLVLDGQTLLNLEIFENSADGTSNGTLFKLLNRCITPQGKRLFKSWVCHPLRDKNAINARLDAVEDLFNNEDMQDTLASCFKRLPDVERSIARIHSGTCRVKDFVSALRAFESIADLFTKIKDVISQFSSSRLISLFSEGFPKELSETLKFFDEAFDHAEAFSSGEIVVRAGYDDPYDVANRAYEDVENEFAEYKKEQQKELGCKNLNYKDMGKDLYQLEVPAKVNVPKDWKLMSKTQSVHRYHTRKIESLLVRFLEVREGREEALRNVRSRLYARFDEHYRMWLRVVQTVAEIDCYLGLAVCRSGLGSPLCRPEFVDSDTNFMEIKDLRHPCLQSDFGKDFIPNDVAIGMNEKSKIILLTGPNMGGKSTLLRQSCIAVIMAQLGCYVPASSCRLTTFDRIFTRIGANDNILAGQSTFMVELSETSKILREATPKSLVILDELGRGTSTFDGYAIAFAVLHHLITRVGCLGLFSTHYGMLTREFENNALVSLNYMNFVSDEERRDVTFLYKLVQGVCPKSFGMNVALMAGVPNAIVDQADEIAAQFENNLRMNHIQDASAHGVRMSRHADFAQLWHGKAGSAKAILKSL